MNVGDLHRQTGEAWDEAAARYEEEIEADIEFLRRGGMNFCPPEWRYLQGLSEWCGRAIHLQCAGGRDTLSLWNAGAREVVGVDISARMIECARRKSDALQAPARWICCDVLDCPVELDATADLVYTGRGALCWVLDLERWAAVVARLLRPGGRLYIFEGHPLAWVWDMEASDLRLDPRYGNYFSTSVESEQGWPATYIGELARPKSELRMKHERQWTLGQIVTTLVRAGLRIVELEEHPDEYWNALPNVPVEMRRCLPQTFSLLAFKD